MARPPRKRRRRRRRRHALSRRFDLHRAMFVLPNLFTLSSIFCGFYAIILASGDPGPRQMFQAALAVLFGNFFDMADGRVARLTRTQSALGVQLDSLADLVTFGLAPAVIVHKWGLSRLGILGAVAAFAYVACGAIRLARFNVLAAEAGGGKMKYFIGLPIPLAAGVLVSLVMFHQQTIARPATRELSILTLILILSYLMISNVRYRSFKDVRPSGGTVTAGLVAVVVFAVIAAQFRPAFALLSFFSGYVVFGMLEEVIFYRRRRREDRRDHAPAEKRDEPAQGAQDEA